MRRALVGGIAGCIAVEDSNVIKIDSERNNSEEISTSLSLCIRRPRGNSFSIIRTYNVEFRGTNNFYNSTVVIYKSVINYLQGFIEFFQFTYENKYKNRENDHRV